MKRRIFFFGVCLLALSFLTSCSKECQCFLPDYAGVGGYAEAKAMGNCSKVDKVIVNGTSYDAICHE